MRGKTGKTLVILLGIFVVLLIAFSGILSVLLVNEKSFRKTSDANLEQLKMIESKLQADVKEARQQIVLLDEKKKEAEIKIESLLEDLDLERGLREEAKKQNQELQSSLQKETEAREELSARLSQDLEAAEERYLAIKTELDAARQRNKDLETAQKKLESQNQDLQQKLSQSSPSSSGTSATAQDEGGVELGKIVVNPAGEGKGKVISIDSDTDFVIVSLGERDGIAIDTVLSIYRGQQYLGDVKVSRVLPEMSAADFIPPLKSQSVQKDDQVVVKK